MSKLEVKDSKISFVDDICEWNDWITGDCSKSCGNGTRTNIRTMKITAEGCDSVESVDESCNVQECPGYRLYSLLSTIIILK